MSKIIFAKRSGGEGADVSDFIIFNHNFKRAPDSIFHYNHKSIIQKCQLDNFCYEIPTLFLFAISFTLENYITTFIVNIKPIYIVSAKEW